MIQNNHIKKGCMGYHFTIENESGQIVFTVEVTKKNVCLTPGIYTFSIRDENGHLSFIAYSEYLFSVILKDINDRWIGQIQNQL